MTADRGEELARIKQSVRCLYDRMGLCVIPCHHPMEPPPPALLETGAWNDDLAGKRPMIPWKKYQNVSPAAAEVSEWFYGEALNNIAILTGPISRVVVLDLDDAEAVAWAEATLPKTPLMVGTSRGQHWYYKWDSSRPLGNQARLQVEGRKINADIRGEGGYVLAPGSRHASGSMYRAIPDNKAWHPKTIDLLPTFPALRFNSPATEPRTSPSDSNPELEKRLIAYVSKWDGKPSGERNDSAYRLAVNLLCDFDAAPDTAWRLVSEWNQRNSPPLEERELRATFASAEKGGTHERGWKQRLGQRPVLRLLQGGAAETVGNLALQPHDEPQRRPQAEPLKTIPWQELPKDSGWKYIVAPAIPRGTVTLLSGDGGLGKSLIACHLAASIARGEDWLRRKIVRPMRSTLFFLEDTLGEVRRRLEDSGLEDPAAVNVFDNRDFTLSFSAEHVNALIKSAEDHGSDLIVIDPVVSAAAATDIDMNKPEAVRKVIDVLSRRAKALDISVLLVAHHNSQGTIQGGKAWSNAVRSHLAVYRHPAEHGKLVLLHAKENVGTMATILYHIGEAVRDVPSSAVVYFEQEIPFSYQTYRELAESQNVDKAGMGEAHQFLKRAIMPGCRHAKKALADRAAADGIRYVDLNNAAKAMGIRRLYVPQPDGRDDLLCWEMPE